MYHHHHHEYLKAELLLARFSTIRASGLPACFTATTANLASGNATISLILPFRHIVLEFLGLSVHQLNCVTDDQFAF